MYTTTHTHTHTQGCTYTHSSTQIMWKVTETSLYVSAYSYISVYICSTDEGLLIWHPKTLCFVHTREKTKAVAESVQQLNEEYYLAFQVLSSTCPYWWLMELEVYWMNSRKDAGRFPTAGKECKEAGWQKRHQGVSGKGTVKFAIPCDFFVCVMLFLYYYYLLSWVCSLCSPFIPFTPCSSFCPELDILVQTANK